MDLRLQDKIIIVSGGSKGIGLGIVKILIEEGAIPVIIGRNRESVLKVIDDFKEKGESIFYAFAELTNPDDCKNAIDKIVQKFGKIDGLVNNAGVNDGVG